MSISLISNHVIHTCSSLRLISFSTKIPLYQNPTFIIAFTFSLLVTLLISVPPKTIPRLLAFSIVTAHASWAFQSMHNAPIDAIFYNICFAVAIIMYANYFLCITLTAPPPHFSALTVLQKSFWAIDTITNIRGIGTSSQPRSLPAFSQHNPSHIPPPREFLVSRAKSVIFFILFLTALSILEQEVYYPSLRDGDYNAEKEQLFRRLRNVSTRELLIRLYLPIQMFADQYATLSLYHALLSILTVGVAGDEPGRWPPLFGDIRAAYSLRRFFGIFWHHIFRTAFVSHASVITHSVLLIPRGTRLARTAITLLVFLISGFLHAILLPLLGGTCSAFPVLYWYFLAAGTIILEDYILGAKKYLGWDNGEGMALRGEAYWRSRLERWMGYVWVWSWFAWSLPKMVFPSFMCWDVGI